MVGCIGISAFAPSAHEQLCVDRTRSVSRFEIANVMRHEPAIVPRVLRHVADQMQVVGVPYLGMFSEQDPRSHPPARECVQL